MTTVADDNEPMITGRDGRVWQPFGLVVIPMVELSKRLLRRAAVDTTLITYRPGYEAGPPGTSLNPVEPPMPPSSFPIPRG